MAATVWNVRWLLAIVMLFVIPCASSRSHRTYYMDLHCGEVLDMEVKSVKWGKLKLTRMSKYRRNMDCWTTIRAPPDHKLLLRFLDMDIHEFFSCDDYVQIFDGQKSNGSALTSKLCDDDTPRVTLTSTHQHVSIHFKSDNFVEDDGFEILFTAYHTGTCKPDEFKCNNGYCIDKRLKCNGYNNCGDNSDACGMTVGSIVGAVAVVAVVALIGIGIYCVVRRRRQSGRIVKTNDPVTIPMNPPAQPYAQPYPTNPPSQYPQAGFVPPPQQNMGQPPYSQYPPGSYPPPSGPYPPPQGYAPPQGYPPQGGYQPPPPGYPQGSGYPPHPDTTQAPPPYQEKPPL